MHRGVSVEIGPKAGPGNDGFVAVALGNRGAFELAVRRPERLQWQMPRVDTSGAHHLRQVVCHPDRAVDLGSAHDLASIPRSPSSGDGDALRRRFETARRNGLWPVPLRHLRGLPDLWHDDFSRALG